MNDINENSNSNIHPHLYLKQDVPSNNDNIPKSHEVDVEALFIRKNETEKLSNEKTTKDFFPFYCKVLSQLARLFVCIYAILTLLFPNDSNCKSKLKRYKQRLHWLKDERKKLRRNFIKKGYEAKKKH